MLNKRLKQKYDQLKNILLALNSAVIAYSGGVDSTLLLYAAKEVLGKKAMAVTVTSVFLPEQEVKAALAQAKQIGCRCKLIRLDILKDQKIRANPENRCYICKKRIMRELRKIAAKNRLRHIAEGSNLDDLNQHRPGKKALKELKIISPLADAGLTKQDIRQLLKHFGFANWQKPASSCLATRFDYGLVLNKPDLEAVRCAETLIKSYGFKQVRVRMHANRLARIELSREKNKNLFGIFNSSLVNKLKKLGFDYICIDPEGYRSGSMDTGLLKNRL